MEISATPRCATTFCAERLTGAFVFAIKMSRQYEGRGWSYHVSYHIFGMKGSFLRRTFSWFTLLFARQNGSSVVPRLRLQRSDQRPATSQMICTEPVARTGAPPGQLAAWLESWDRAAALCALPQAFRRVPVKPD